MTSGLASSRPLLEGHRALPGSPCWPGAAGRVSGTEAHAQKEDGWWAVGRALGGLQVRVSG